jgi:hypothetical protein
MKKDAGWKHGGLPENAMQAFHHLQSLLCLHPFWHIQGLIHNSLITNASFGNEYTAGGLGAILTQIDNEGQFFVITYARRKLQKYEQKYTQLFYIHVKIKDFDIKMARQL